MLCDTQNKLIPFTLSSLLENLVEIWTIVSSIKELIIFLITCLVIICLVVYIITRWKSQINKRTLQKIDKYKNTKKYIDSIFVELNNTKELLRYFLHGKKWRLRIINIYNALFNTYTGKLAKKNVCGDVKFYLPFYSSFKIINENIEKAITFFELVRGSESSKYFKEDVGDLSYFIERMSYSVNELLQNINKLVTMCRTNYILAIGNAGNGKTNLLCNYSETVIKYKRPCIFIDAKEIKGNIEEFISDEFNIPNIIKSKIGLKLYFNIYSLILHLRREYIFVIIDALNENDDDDFCDNIKKFFNLLNKYSKIKILVSCRSEYFNERFKKIFDEMNTQFTIMDINEAKYDLRAKEKALINYQTLFNVKGAIVGSAKEKLFTSLLLMRIFFEVNSGKEVNTLELRNAEIYKQYIKKISEKINELGLEINFQNTLNKITNSMMENNTYDGIPINELNFNTSDLSKFKSILDENIIINKRIITGTGITETENEIVYFVFDELRDFCISRKILIDCEKQTEYNYKLLFNFLNIIDKNKLSPLEGVLKYSYYHLKNDSTNPNHLVFCKKILNEYGDSIKHDIYDRLDKQNNIFSNIGILIILSDSSYLEDFELDYIVKSVRRISDFWNMLNIFFDNEISGNGLKTDIFVNILLNYTVEGITNIIKDMTEESVYHFSSDPNYLEKFYLKTIRQNDISNSLKWILIFMYNVGIKNKKIKDCIIKFNIGEKEKNNFIEWLLNKKFSNSHIEEISVLIGFKGGAK